MRPIWCMSISEAISTISGLMVQLIERVKDGKTAALVQQVQLCNQTIQTAYFEAKQEVADTKAKHVKEISDLNALHAKEITALQKQIADLKAAQAQSPDVWPDPKNSHLNHNF